MKSVQMMMMGKNAFTQGKYTIAELNQMILTDGYIPVASGAELDALRNTKTQQMGVGTIWGGNYTTGKDKKYVQAKNISLIDYQSGDGFPQFLSTETGFILDGNELNISDLISTVGVSTSGLFRTVTENTTLKNIRLNGVMSQNDSGGVNCGLLCGENNGNIINCICSGDVISAGSFVGGFVGANTLTGIITSSYFTGTVSGASYGTIGGFVGANYGVIKYSHSDSVIAITAGQICGGFVGYQYNTTTSSIEECYSLGSIVGDVKNLIGGFVGLSYKIISNCYTKVNISNGGDSICGFGTLSTASVTTNCFSIGNVVGVSNVNGFSRGTGNLVVHSYWDTQTSGQATSAGGTGKTTAEMKTGTIPDTAIFVDWDALIWQGNGSGNYPTLINNPE